jgi:transcriptional regulator with XRE-family HTH domain
MRKLILKKVLRRKKISQKKLANITGFDKKTLKDIINGDEKTEDITLQLIADKLEVEFEELFEHFPILHSPKNLSIFYDLLLDLILQSEVLPTLHTILESKGLPLKTIVEIEAELMCKLRPKYVRFFLEKLTSKKEQGDLHQDEERFLSWLQENNFPKELKKHSPVGSKSKFESDQKEKQYYKVRKKFIEQGFKLDRTSYSGFYYNDIPEIIRKFFAGFSDKELIRPLEIRDLRNGVPIKDIEKKYEDFNGTKVSELRKLNKILGKNRRKRD